MPALDQLAAITGNGTYTMSNLRPGMEYVIGISGSVGTPATFGGGSIALNWRIGNATGTYENSPITAAASFVAVSLGTDMDFILTGATSPNFRITVNSLVK